MIDQVYSVEYGEYMVRYRVEGDIDGPKAFIETIASEYGTIDKVMFDSDVLKEIKEICECDFGVRVLRNYMKTGEIL